MGSANPPERNLVASTLTTVPVKLVSVPGDGSLLLQEAIRPRKIAIETGRHILRFFIVDWFIT
jgi:hypothetical protein